MIDSMECRRQALLCEAEARTVSDPSIQITLHSMAEGWTTLARQFDWLEIKKKNG
jgi:hypothetical protein